MKKLFSIVVSFVLTFFVINSASADTYNVDVAHSTLGFEVSHLMVGITKGEFGDYTGTIDFDPNSIEATQIKVTIQSTSIDTKNTDRDNHLRNPDFFDTDNHPILTFKSTHVWPSGEGDGRVEIVGDLTMRGVTKSITIPAKILGPIQSPFGSTVIGIAGEVTVNRQDFGISWNKDLDQGGVVIGNDVLIQINVEAHKK